MTLRLLETAMLVISETKWSFKFAVFMQEIESWSGTTRITVGGSLDASGGFTQFDISLVESGNESVEWDKFLKQTVDNGLS